MDGKPLLWVGSTREDLRDLPREARKELGLDLRRVQSGHMPRDWKPMASVGAGVVEIRVRTGNTYRLMYVAKFVEGIYVLHVFQKKSQKTAGIDLEVARTRLAAVRRARTAG
ncbi:MAG: type II toxin-antitoxin system RelE/ParE family toxin [Armatimonadetes bacterium]|nr:type II toxin-antitoxin system RelE/ParE family toxin [Armatimonadota bacterium]